MLRSWLFPISVFCVLFLLPSVGRSQDGLPHALSPAEIPLIRPYRDSRATAARGITTPPAFPVRTMAEWEEVQAVVITWSSFTGILKQIVRIARTECEVIVVCNDQNSVISYLQGPDYGGPIGDMAGVTFLETGYNSIWSRDYMAESIYANEVDSLYLLDWIYNRPRPADDGMSDAIAQAMGIGVYSTTAAPYDLVHTGGNFMCDGAGTAFSSELVLTENGPGGEYNQTVRDAAGVDQIMEQFMGIAPGRYIKMQTLPFDAIHHIDMHMKLLDEETLLVGEFPVGVSDGPQLESNIAAIMAAEISTYGDPYKLIRIPMPPSVGGNYAPSASYRTFANNVFINGTVIVPTYRTEYDTVGLRILGEALPGYRIVGIDCDSEQNIIQQSGAIHCITKAIGVADPLLIRHQPLADTGNSTEPYEVSAYMRHRSGIASARMFWTVDTAAGFAMVPMSGIGNDRWSASIPAHVGGSRIFYYVEGTSNSGKVLARPIVAPAGWWRFRVLDLNTSIGTDPLAWSVEVYPNPTSSLLVVGFPQAVRGKVEVTLTDMLGRVVLPIHQGRLPADGRLFADLASLEAAPYVLVLRTAGGVRSMRVLKR